MISNVEKNLIESAMSTADCFGLSYINCVKELFEQYDIDREIDNEIEQYVFNIVVNRR